MIISSDLLNYCSFPRLTNWYLTMLMMPKLQVLWLLGVDRKEKQRRRSFKNVYLYAKNGAPLSFIIGFFEYK